MVWESEPSPFFSCAMHNDYGMPFAPVRGDV